MTIKVALIGAGGIGEAHSSAYGLIPQAQVVAVVDVRPERAELIANRHGAHPYTSLEKMISQETPDMVDICVPSYLHKEIVLLCFAQNWHVLCEKPIAMTQNDAEMVAAAAQQRGRKFMIAQVIRFWPEYRVLKAAYSQMTYGKLLQLSLSRTSGAPQWCWEGWYTNPKVSGLAPFELGIHDIDFINYLLGKPAQVSATELELPELYLSHLNSQFVYPGGPQVEIEAAWYAGPIPFAANYRAVFERAVLDYRNNELTLYQADEKTPQKVDAALGVGIPTQISFSSQINLPDAGPIYNEIAYFIGCLEHNRFPEVITPQDSLISLHMLLTALESSRQGKTLNV